jgi:hypothetical protein
MGMYIAGVVTVVVWWFVQNAARKANQMAIVAEKKREDAPEESRGISKKKWFEEKQKKLGKQLESNGLDMSKAYMLDTQEDAEYKYKKWDKKPAPFGWDGECQFNPSASVIFLDSRETVCHWTEIRHPISFLSNTIASVIRAQQQTCKC